MYKEVLGKTVLYKWMVRERITKWAEDSVLLGEVKAVSEEGGTQKITCLC